LEIICKIGGSGVHKTLVVIAQAEAAPSLEFDDHELDLESREKA